MNRDVDEQAMRRLAQAQADAVARCRAAKRRRRLAQHRQRLEQTSEPSPLPWLAAVERDDDRESSKLEELAEQEQVA